MHSWRTIALLVLVNFTARLCLAEDSTTINLGGLRKVEVTVVEKDEHFIVTATMIPVRSFDAAMNKQLNRQKAEAYALVGLGRYLTKHEQGTVAIQTGGVAIIEANLQDNRYRLQLEVVRSSVRAKVKEEAAAPAKKRGSPSLLTDYNSLIEDVASAAERELPALPENSEGMDAFYRAVADCEDRTAQRYDQLQKEIETDRRLLNLEREHFFGRIEDKYGAIVEMLKRQVAESERLVDDAIKEEP
jgi:hypothetical protein